MKSIKMLLMATLTILSLAVFAQHKTMHKSKMDKHKMEQAKYTCPMHPGVTSNKPGKCSQCGMDLTRSKKEQMKMETMKMYSCPMHPEVTGDKPGKCSKCNRDMKEKNVAFYSCPMHPEVTSNNPGKCSKCGMNLVEKKE